MWQHSFTEATYTHWNSGEPNNDGGNEDCVLLVRKHVNAIMNKVQNKLLVPFRGTNFSGMMEHATLLKMVAPTFMLSVRQTTSRETSTISTGQDFKFFFMK